MHPAIIYLAGIASPFILIATLWNVWKESCSRSLMLRMTPPERRPPGSAVRPFRISAGAGTRVDRNSQSHPLWTLRDCQMELLTEGTMHAFDASFTAYRPARVAANRRPGNSSSRISLERANVEVADSNSILLRTLERTAHLLGPKVADIYAANPVSERDSGNRLSYLRPAH